MSNPNDKTAIVRREHPFHSFNKMPHTLEKTTFSDINILHEKASSTGDATKKVLPNSNPKNCEYHSNPAKAQKSTLLSSVGLSTAIYSLPVWFLTF